MDKDTLQTEKDEECDEIVSLEKQTKKDLLITNIIRMIYWRINTITRILLLAWFLSGFLEGQSQFNWQKIPLQSLSEIEDIAVSRNKFIYIAVKGREIILLSKDLGESWQDIIIDKELGKYTNQSKDLYIDHQDSLYVFYQDGSTYLRKWNGASSWRWINTQLQDLSQLTGSTNLKFNINGEYFICEGQTFFKYKELWSKKERLFDLPDLIVDYYLDVDGNSYCVTFDGYFFKYYSLDIQSNNYKYLGEFKTANIYIQLSNAKYRTTISDSSKIFVASDEGLFVSYNNAKAWQKVNL